jgi:hypothetical protein
MIFTKFGKGLNTYYKGEHCVLISEAKMFFYSIYNMTNLTLPLSINPELWSHRFYNICAYHYHANSFTA